MLNQRFALTALAVVICQMAYADVGAENQKSGSAGASSAAVAPTLDPIKGGSTAPSTAPATASQPLAPPPAAVQAPVTTGADGEDSKYEPRIMRGNDRVIAPAKAVAGATGADSTFKFEEAPISEVVHVMLGEILKADYVIHQPVNGAVTLATRGNVSPDQAIFLLESALQANGIQMVRDARGTYHVGRPDVLKGIVAAPRQFSSMAALPPGSGAIIVPLEYIGATEMATILKPMLPPDALLRVDNLRNLLILAGTRTQAESWLELISTFDVDLLKGMSVGVFPLKYATVGEVDAALRLMTGGGAAAPGAAGAAAAKSGAPANTAGGAAGAGSAEGNPFFGAMRIMPIERINSILVVAPRASSLDEARRWIEKFDRPSDNGSESQLFVYPVQNGAAVHLATVLSGIFGGSGGSQSSTGTGVAPGLGSSAASTSGFGSQGTSNLTGGGTGSSVLGGRAGSSNNRQGGQNNSSVSTTTFGQGGVRVIADEVNNALLIYAPHSEYAKIESALRRLDSRSAQVLIEATIIEVTLTDTLQYGLQWAFTDGGTGAGYTGRGQLINNDKGGVFPPTDGFVPSNGFTYTLTNAAGQVRAALNLLATKGLVNVISSPSVMVMDNQTAAISVGDQIPIQTNTTTNNIATVQGYEYKDTGVELEVTPSVNAGNIVTMQLAQTISGVGAPSYNATGRPAFSKRQLGTKVAVRSGETLVLGGIILDNTTTSKSGIPLLQDIPYLGSLFRTTKNDKSRTELLVILTPRVIRSDEDARELNDEVRSRMKSFATLEALEPRHAGTATGTESNGISVTPFNQGVVTP